jgi:hypothetical protein
MATKLPDRITANGTYYLKVHPGRELSLKVGGDGGDFDGRTVQLQDGASETSTPDDVAGESWTALGRLVITPATDYLFFEVTGTTAGGTLDVPVSYAAKPVFR